MRPGQDPAVLHPDDLLVDEGADLFPAGLKHRLAARGVPAIPGGVLGDGFRHGCRDEAVVKLGPLRTVVPGCAIGCGPVLVAGRMVRAVVVDKVRRVGGEQDRPLAVHQATHIGSAGAVATEQPVIAKDPEIVCPRRRVARRFGDGHRRHGAPGATFFTVVFRDVGQQLVQLAVGEADQRQVEILGQQVVQFGRQQRLVPSAEFGELVVRDAVRPSLRLGQMPEHDHRRLGEPELRRREHPAVARDQFAVLADEAGHGPTELGHAGGDLRDLVCAMRLRVLRVGLEARQRPGLDRVRGEAQRHGGQGSSVGWMPVASGLRMPCWTPHGVQRLPAVSGRKASVHWFLRGARVAPASGWLPKNPALSLAMSRASPASIRISPGRNRKLPGGGLRPDPRWIPGSRRPPSAQRGERAFQRTLPILPSE